MSRKLAKSLLIGSLSVALVFAGARTASAYEAASPAFSGGSSTMTGSGLTQTWVATGATVLAGTATTAGSQSSPPETSYFAPAVAPNTPSQSVQTNVDTCTAPGACSGLGTLSVSFGHPVVNPTIHIAGLGGSDGITLFHVTLTASSVTLTKVSGAGGNSTVTGGNTVTANTETTSDLCNDLGSNGATNDAVCGSFRVNGTVSQVSFTVNGETTDGVTTTGNVDEYLVFATADTDYGDAPATYDAGNAARAVLSDIRLGTTVDADDTTTLDATTNAAAGVGATNDGGDDGVTLAALPTIATSYSATVALSGASAAGEVCGWIDVNKNGVFDAGERQCSAVSVGQTSATLTWTGLSGLTAGTTYARFRVGYNVAQTQSPTGAADSGEVEDYALPIVVIAAPTATPDAPSTLQDVGLTFNPLTNDTAAAATSLDPTSVRLLDPTTSEYGTSVTIADEGTYTVNPSTGQVTFVPLRTFTGTATSVTYRVADGYGQTATSTIAPHVNPVTPAPVNDTATTPYNTPTTVDVLSNDLPGDGSAPLTPSTVTLYDSSTSTYETSLTVAGQGTYTVDAVTGAVTFTPVTGYQGTGTAVTYRVTDDNGTTATAALTVTVGAPPSPRPANDSTTTPQGVAVTLNTLGNDDLSTEGAALVPASVLLEDPSDSTFKSSVTIENQGTWTVDAGTGDVTFTPDPTFVGTATQVTYRVSDTNGASAQAFEHVVVAAVTPVAHPDGTTTPYETPVTVPVVTNDVAGNDSVALVASSVQLKDPADSVWKTSVTVAGVGTFAVQAGGSVMFTPAQGYTGTASLPYRVADANGTFAPSTVAVTVSEPPAPAALPDTTTTAQGVAVTVLPLTNDTSDDAAPLNPASVRLLSGATPVTTLTVADEGTYVANPDGSVTFTPLPTFHGVATDVHYQVADEAGQLASSTITATVTEITPTAADDAATTPYAHTVTVPLLSNDAYGAPSARLAPGSVKLHDPADGLWRTTVSLSGVGTYVVNPDGSTTFTPAAGYSGTTVDLPYEVADSNGTYVQATVHVTVGQAPVANLDAGSTPQGIPTTVDILNNDAPGAGATLVPASVTLYDTASSTYTTSVSIPGQGTYTVNPTDGSVTFTPLTSFHGSAQSVQYRVTDSDGNTASSTVSISVIAPTPVAKPDTATTPYKTPVTVPLLANDNAGSGVVPLLPGSVQILDPSTTLYASTVMLPGVGTFVVQPDGSALFTPVPGFTGLTPVLTYLVDDANGTMATSSVSVDVSLPAAPEAKPVAATTPQGIAVTVHTLGDDTSDPASPLDPASVRIIDPVAGTYESFVTVANQGTYTVDGATGDVLFTPLPSFHGVATPVTYGVADEAGQLVDSTITVTVDAITPVVKADTATTPYLHQVNVPLLANDSEGAATAPLLVGTVRIQDPSDLGWKTSVTVPGMGTYVVQPNGSVTFTPQAGYSGTTAALPYEVADSNGTYATAAVTIHVGTPPTASPDLATTPQGLPVTTGVTANDTPGAGATLDPSTVLLEDPTNTGTWVPVVVVPGEGTYTVNATGGVVLTPDPTFHGTATAISYRALDTDGNVAVSTLTVTVTQVIPVAKPDTTTTPYETTVNVPLLANDHPGDPGVPLTPSTVQLLDTTDSTWKSAVTHAGVGAYAIQPDGSVSFTPAQGYTGTTPALTYRVADANTTFAQSTVTVTVSEPAAPIAVDDLATTLQGTPVTLPALGNDSHAPAAPLDPASVELLDPASSTYRSSVTIPGQGTYTVAPATGDVTFAPVATFHGTATPVTYEVKDEAGQVTTAAVRVTVNAVTPVATPDSATTPYGHPVTVPLVSDDSPGDPSIPLVLTSVNLKDPSDGTWKKTVSITGVGTWTVNPDGSAGFTPAAGYRGTTVALPYGVADINGTYAHSTVTITVQTPPHATPDTGTALQGQPLSVAPLTNDTAGGTATLVPGSLLLLDPSDTTYKTSVTIAGEGTYTVNPNTHEVDFSPVLTFSGPAAPVTYQVTDTDSNTATSTITITVAPLIPVALPDNASTPYAHSVNIALLTNDSAGDLVAPLIPGSVQLKNPATGLWATTVTVTGVGTYVVQPNGSVTFTPAAGFTGSANALPYRVADSNGTVTSSTVSVVVGAPPVAAPDATATLQNQPVTIGTVGNDQPGTGATLVPSSVELVDPTSGLLQPVVMVPNQGTYAVDSATGAIVFEPVPWFSGFTTPVEYQVADSDTNTATSTVSVHVTAVVPAVVSDSATTPFRTPVTIPVLANDAAGDATAPLAIASVVLEDPADGLWKKTVTITGKGTFAVQSDGQVRFIPDTGYEGIVGPAVYRVTDANGTSGTAVIDVVIGNAPMAAPDIATTLQGHPVMLPLLANDHPGAGGTLTPGSTQLLDPADGTYKSGVTIADEGTWTVDPATGSVTFTPLPGYVGHTTPVAYEVTDSYGNTATSTAKVTVAEVVPTASGDTATTPFRTPVTVAVLANDSAGRSDTPLDPTTVQLKDPATGSWGTTVTVDGVGTWTVTTEGSVAFTPVVAFDGVTAPLAYEVADSNGTYSESTLVITVNAPYGALSDSDSATGSGSAPVTLSPLANDTPSKGATWIPSSVCLVPDSAKAIAGTALGDCAKSAVVVGMGTWVVNPDGTLTFTPVAGFTGSASIGYLVTDTNGAEVSNTALVTVTTLPNTGGPAMYVGVVGVLLLLAGGMVLFAARRRPEEQA